MRRYTLNNSSFVEHHTIKNGSLWKFFNSKLLPERYWNSTQYMTYIFFNILVFLMSFSIQYHIHFITRWVTVHTNHAKKQFVNIRASEVKKYFIPLNVFYQIFNIFYILIVE